MAWMTHFLKLFSIFMNERGFLGGWDGKESTTLLKIQKAHHLDVGILNSKGAEGRRVQHMELWGKTRYEL